MTTIKEDYVSFGTAKALKEKGFDIPCDYAYNNKAGYFEVDRSNFDEVYCFRPSLAMAMKWLREVNNICITIYPDGEKGYEAVLYDVKDDVEIILQSFGIFGTHIFEESYEQACAAAIKYCLENLI